MPVTNAFLATCRTAIGSLAELSTYRTAYALYDAASHNDKALYWQRCFSDSQLGQSPAMALKKAIRNTVIANADATISPTEREEAYRTLIGEYVGEPQRPMTNGEEKAALEELLIQEKLS